MDTCIQIIAPESGGVGALLRHLQSALVRRVLAPPYYCLTLALGVLRPPGVRKEVLVLGLGKIVCVKQTNKRIVYSYVIMFMFFFFFFHQQLATSLLLILLMDIDIISIDGY